MASFGKWLGGGLGWAFGGPIGAIIGVAIGHLFDNTNVQFQKDSVFNSGGPQTSSTTQNRTQTKTHAGDFSVSLLVLSAAVMKADGKVLRSELDYVKQFLVKQFGEATALELLQVLKEILQKDVPLKQVSDQIRANMPHAMRLQLLHYLFGIANADGSVHKTESLIIERISVYLGISTKDFQSINGMFFKDVGHAYKVLEVEPTATDDEIKKAYRKMAIKYHPDKVADLGEDFQKAAKEKFQKLQEAYDQIKKERGIK